MAIEIIGLDQSDRWDAIVKTFENFDVYWLSGYVKSFYLHGDGEPILVYCYKNSTRGINVVMKRDISLDERFRGKIKENEFFDLSTPYGYGGWIIEGEDRNDIFIEYESWICKNGIISEFVRFHPMIENHHYCVNYYDVTELGEVVHMDISSPDVIWENIISKNRNMIRKAIKNEVKIFNGRFPEVFDEFQKIYSITMDKDNADKYYYFQKDFFDSILEDLPHNSQIFWAQKDGKIISASIMLMANGMINYHLSGSLSEYSSLAPTNLLLYECAMWGCANGYKTLYLGGGVGSGEDGLFKFKRSFFKGDLKHFHIGKKIYDKERYEYLVGLRPDSSDSFFPKYRARN